MQKTQETEGIILKLSETTNGAYVMTVITEEHALLNIYAAYAKNSKSRFGKLDLLDWGILSYSDNPRGLHNLAQFAPRSSFPGIRSSLEKIIVSSCLAEIVGKISPENDPNCPDNFLILRDLLLALEPLADLKNILKNVHQALFQLLHHSGGIDCQPFEQPSAKNLSAMIRQTETYLGQNLKSSSELQGILKTLYPAN